MQKKGITLVALVVTIIVLLLLVGVTLGVVLGEDGVIAKAQNSKIESRYASIQDKVVIRETSLAVASLAGKAEEDHYVFVQNLRTQGLITDDELEAYDEDTRTLYIGKLKDGSYKFEIVIPDDPENIGSGKNMILTIEIEYDDQIIYLPISNATNLSINWDVKNSNHFEEQPDNSENPIHRYEQAGIYDVEIEGMSEPNTTFGMKFTVVGKTKPLDSKPKDASVYKELVSASKTSKTYITKIAGERERFLPAPLYLGNIIGIKSWGENGFTHFHPIGINLLDPLPTPSKKSFEKVISFDSTFSYSNLTTIPAGLFANCPNVISFDSAFSVCSKLKNIPVRLFANCPNVTSFNSTFSECSKLTNLPTGIFLNCSNVISFHRVFKGCKGLINIPVDLFSSCLNVINFESAFSSCENLTSIPANLFVNNQQVESFSDTFSHCWNLGSIPEGLFDNCLNVLDFSGTFNGCQHLAGMAPALWERNNVYGYNCFRSCLDLSNYTSIDPAWK